MVPRSLRSSTASSRVISSVVVYVPLGRLVMGKATVSEIGVEATSLVVMRLFEIGMESVWAVAPVVFTRETVSVKFSVRGFCDAHARGILSVVF